MLDDSLLCAKLGATDTTSICQATRGEVSRDGGTPFHLSDKQVISEEEPRSKV